MEGMQGYVCQNQDDCDYGDDRSSKDTEQREARSRKGDTDWGKYRGSRVQVVVVVA